MNNELKQLIHQAKLVGCSLFTGDKIRLIIYDKNGNVSKTYKYDYEESDYAIRIQHHIDRVAESLRKTWGADFLELAPIAFPLGYSIKVDNYSAKLIGTTNSKGEVSKDEIELLECPFSSEGLHAMSDYIANALLGEELNDAGENQKEEEEIMEEVVLTKELARVITVMYFRMSPEEQQGIKDTADKNINLTIKKALKIAAEG